MRKILFGLLAALVFLCAACGSSGGSPAPETTSTPDPLPGLIYRITEVGDYLGVNSAQPAVSGGVSGWAVTVESKQDPMDNMGFTCLVFQKAPTTEVGDFAMFDCLDEGQSQAFMPIGYYVAYVARDFDSAAVKVTELNEQYKQATPEESR